MVSSSVANHDYIIDTGKAEPDLPSLSHCSLFFVSTLRLANMMLILCSFPFCGVESTPAVLRLTLQGDTHLAPRCLQGLTDDNDEQESDSTTLGRV